MERVTETRMRHLTQPPSWKRVDTTDARGRSRFEHDGPVLLDVEGPA